MMREIMFAKADLKSYLAALRPLWGKRPAWLVGDGQLATGLAAVAKRKNVLLQRGMPPSGAVDPVVIFTETDGAALHLQLLNCLDLKSARVLAPVTDRHFSRHPLYLISIPKAGTHLVYELARALGYHAGIEAPEFPRPQTWYCLEYSNSHTAAADFFVDSVRRAPFGNRHHPFMKSPALFVYRHPLDILVSEAHYYHLDGKSSFAGWFSDLDFSERAERLMNENFLLGSLRARVGAFLPWLEFPNVVSLSFEELVGAAGGGVADAQLDLIWSIMLKLQIPGDPQEISATLYNREAATFRSGQIRAYLKELPTRMIERFSETNGDILSAFGYDIDATEQLPARRHWFRNRTVCFSKVDFDQMPITIEPCFMECNLVRYAQRIYAVPLAAGDVDLVALPAAALAALPSGPDVATVKALMLTGLDEYERHLQALRQLGAYVKSSLTAQGYHAYWRGADQPRLVETYQAFNIVAYQERFYGIRQALGPILLDGDVASLVAKHSMSDLMVATSVAQLRDEIDEISAAQRLRVRVDSVQAQLMSLNQTVAAGRQKLLSDVEDLETEMVNELTKVTDHVTRQADSINRLSAVISETAGVASQAQEQLGTLETDVATLSGKIDHHAASSKEAARVQAQGLRREIIGLREVLERGIAATAEMVQRAETAIAALTAQTAALAEAQAQQSEAIDALRSELVERLAENAKSTHGRLDLQLDELIFQRGILTSLRQREGHDGWWWRRKKEVP